MMPYQETKSSESPEDDTIDPPASRGADLLLSLTKDSRNPIVTPMESAASMASLSSNDSSSSNNNNNNTSSGSSSMRPVENSHRLLYHSPIKVTETTSSEQHHSSSTAPSTGPPPIRGSNGSDATISSLERPSYYHHHHHPTGYAPAWSPSSLNGMGPVFHASFGRGVRSPTPASIPKRQMLFAEDERTTTTSSSTSDGAKRPRGGGEVEEKKEDTDEDSSPEKPSKQRLISPSSSNEKPEDEAESNTASNSNNNALPPKGLYTYPPPPPWPMHHPHHLPLYGHPPPPHWQHPPPPGGVYPPMGVYPPVPPYAAYAHYPPPPPWGMYSPPPGVLASHQPYRGNTDQPPLATGGKENAAKPGDDAKPSTLSSDWTCSTSSSSLNRCIPLTNPVPNKYWSNSAALSERALPDFTRLVNYPDYLSRGRHGDKAMSSDGQRNCVMCGLVRRCSVSNTGCPVSRRPKHNSSSNATDDATSNTATQHIIPRQNKGVCTVCDVAVWMYRDPEAGRMGGQEIKWCKGCKNFRPWAAFGEKGAATKCARCRLRQREKYATQKNELRLVTTTDRGGTEHHDDDALSSPEN